MVVPRSSRITGAFAAPTVLTGGGCTRGSDAAYQFALLGDNPYPPEDVPKFEALITDVNARTDLQWVLHVGDISGRQPCSDDLYQARFSLYQRFEAPFVYTPGDNDWFDCVGESQGGYDEYERLRALRSVFFANPTQTTGGRVLPVESQASHPDYAEFVENVMWTRGPVVYSTVHLISLTRPPTNPEAADRRTDAALNWIETAFSTAREQGSSGVFIAMQADPWLVSGLPVLIRQLCEVCTSPRPGLERLYGALLNHSTQFDGQVVLAVGDTHIFRVDKPLYRDDGTLVENFTRVETFGNPSVHWVRVEVDPNDRQLFTFHQELVPANTTSR